MNVRAAPRLRMHGHEQCGELRTRVTETTRDKTAIVRIGDATEDV